MARVDSLSMCKDSVRFAPGPKLSVPTDSDTDFARYIILTEICPKLLSLDRYLLFLDILTIPRESIYKNKNLDVELMSKRIILLAIDGTCREILLNI